MAQWKKGESGNPGGRPRGAAGMAMEIRKATRNGQELLEYLLGQFREGATDQIRTEALKLLYDRGWGKAAQVYEIQGEIKHTLNVDLTRLSFEQLKKLEELTALALPAPFDT